MSIISAITFISLGAVMGYFAARLIHPKVDNSELEQELEVTRENLKQQEIYWQLHKTDSLNLLDQLDKTYSKLTQHLQQDSVVNTYEAKTETEALATSEVAEPIALTAVTAATQPEQKSQQAKIETTVESVEKKDTSESKEDAVKKDTAPPLTVVNSDQKVKTEVENEQKNK